MINYKIKNILVPFDLSNSALNALKVADKFACEFNARIHLLNIIEPALSHEPPGFSSGYYTAIQRYSSDSANAIEKYIFKNFINPGAYSYQTRFGFYCSSIEKEVECNEYDLIILPDDTNSFFSRLLSKYKPLKIMELTKIPVIAVNQFYRIVDLRNIILPIRNVANWYEKIPFMVSLVKQTGGKIHIVGINEEKIELNSEFNVILDKAIAIIEHENVLSTIKKIEGENYLKEFILHSKSLNGDLIAITPTKKKTILNSLISPQLYSRLIYNSPAPIFGVQLS